MELRSSARYQRIRLLFQSRAGVSLDTVLSYDNLFQATDPHYLEITARRVLSRLTFDFAFLKQQRRKDDLADVLEIDGIVLHVPSVTRIVEDLGRSLSVSLPRFLYDSFLTGRSVQTATKPHGYFREMYRT